MQRIINVKELRATLPKIVENVRKGEHFTVLYRSRPAFRIVPIEEEDLISCPLSNDPLYRAKAFGESSGGMEASDHDTLLYGHCEK
ncbi:MAG: type II toxin-antitoxin system prevent-host-death family antitoxin [Deltaproteobacteria bacterium]|nr:type II toxin-antitoxin system prevent-host-death family antitoxin [Deltaproteobacteria bacterium]